MAELFSLEGKVALVTGARSGIGGAIAVALAGAGADVVIHGRDTELHDTAAAIRAYGRTPTIWTADLAQPESYLDSLRELVTSTRIDILVNNAGLVVRDPAHEIDLESWRAVLAVNLDAAFLLAQEAGRAMVERRAGKIITIASMMSFQGGLNQAAYAASKHGVVGLTKALSNEWAPFNVQVNALAPGYVETALTRAHTDVPARKEAIRDRIPAGRWGTPSDMAGAAVFLASPASDYVTGHVLAVDGGWLAR